ncbi:transmembrane protein 59-like isoform X2 [Ambystoma mexicanum]|uniref:transmembrane protein 59-like isoform X2 n=1 Tax=Ambystoma mexicanum TaxID=8296 RepID=UPI0037E9327D
MAGAAHRLELLCVHVFCVAFMALAFPADPMDAQFGDTAPCKSECRIRYGQGGPKEEAVLVACYRGCRLFSICHFVDASAALNVTKFECVQACLEAYSKVEEWHGCRTGCINQFPVVERRNDQKFEIKPISSSSMFDLISGFCSNIFSSAQSFISSTWTFYLQADDGKVVVFQSQPEVEYPVTEVQASRSDVTENSWYPPRFNTMKTRTGAARDIGAAERSQRAHERKAGPWNAATCLLRKSWRTPRKAGGNERLDKNASKPAKTKQKLPHFENSHQQEHDILGCISKRSGLPRWILAACLFLSIMVMLWLSCATLVTAPDQHVKTQDLLKAADCHALPVVNNPSDSICDDDDSSGPLYVSRLWR